MSYTKFTVRLCKPAQTDFEAELLATASHDRLPAATCYPATPEPRSTSIQPGGATGEAKRGAPAAAPAQPARSSVIIG